jgi:hypothetical protein
MYLGQRKKKALAAAAHLGLKEHVNATPLGGAIVIIFVSSERKRQRIQSKQVNLEGG